LHAPNWDSSLHLALWLAYINLEAQQHSAGAVSTVCSLYDRALAALEGDDVKNMLWENYIGFVQHRGSSLDAVEVVRNSQLTASGELTHASRKRKQMSSVDGATKAQRVDARGAAAAAAVAPVAPQWPAWPQQQGYSYGAPNAHAAAAAPAAAAAANPYGYGAWPQQQGYPSYPYQPTY